jgi:hypothetical protein
MFGVFVEGLGDVTGDGLPDFAVNSSGYWNAQVPSTVRLYSWVNPAPVWTAILMMLNHPPYIVHGPASSMAAAEDVNGDGVEDIVVGFLDESPVFGDPQPPGIVRVLSGATGALLHAFVGFFPNQAFGKSVGRLGDLDGVAGSSE